MLPVPSVVTWHYCATACTPAPNLFGSFAVGVQQGQIVLAGRIAKLRSFTVQLASEVEILGNNIARFVAAAKQNHCFGRTDLQWTRFEQALPLLRIYRTWSCSRLNALPLRDNAGTVGGACDVNGDGSDDVRLKHLLEDAKSIQEALQEKAANTDYPC